MDRKRRGALAGAAVTGALLLAGCAAKPDRGEIVTWTDAHGRACTGVVMVDPEDAEREVTGIDCDYPPQGRQPGRRTTEPLPD
ncbi:hypothetical protein ACIF8T_26880 [Streptomyces sp. NPDC085946]|uniref:hypothetical protein n=1 Tax=Streptomyces sp. NPDC085946 TaxID=3365744 RepID=UPI0037CEB4FF